MLTDMFICPSRLLVVLLAGTLVALAAPAQPATPARPAGPIQVQQGSLVQVAVNLTIHTCGFGLKELK